MTTITLSKVTSRGRITLPREIQEGLDVQEGEELALQEVAKGIVLLVKAPLSRTQVAERLLDSLVVSIGQEAEKMGIREEDDLDAIVKALRRRSCAERYGGQTV
jgi:AbrB family looped-hinge helix DNA binding protein